MDVFLDVANKPIVASSPDTNLNSLGSLQIGAGSTVFRADETGIWAGASTFSTAPFSVDMSGNLNADSVSLTGYIATGGGAADVNAGVTTISGGKITTGTINGSAMVANTITAGQIASGAIDTDELAAGAITASKISAGEVSASKLDSDVISGGKIIAGLLTADNITAGTLSGVTVQSSSGSSKVVLDDGDSLDFYNGGVLRISLTANSAGLLLSSDLYATSGITTNATTPAPSNDGIFTGTLECSKLEVNTRANFDTASNSTTSGDLWFYDAGSSNYYWRSRNGSWDGQFDQSAF